MSEAELREEEINVLLNQAFLEEKEPIFIQHPLLDLDLFRIDLKKDEWKAKLLVSENKYKKKRNNIARKASEEIRAEVPKFEDIRSILISTGVFETKEYGKNLENTIKKLKSSPSKYTIALDTNLLYNRFITSTLYPIIQNHKEIQHKVIWTLSNVVVEEISHKRSSKYSKNQIKELKRIGGEEYQNLFNEISLNRREAMMATEELKFLRDKIGIDLIKENEPKEDEKNDDLIVKDYKKTKKIKDRDPILISFDKDQKNTAEIHNIETCILEYPNLAQSDQINHQNIYSLIKNLAQRYGIIQLKGTGAKAFGVWEGMAYDKFYNGTIKTIFEEDSTLAPKVKKTKKTSRKLKSLIKK